MTGSGVSTASKMHFSPADREQGPHRPRWRSARCPRQEIGRGHRVGQDSETEGTVERVANPAIRTAGDESVLLPRDNGVREVGPRLRRVQISSPPARTPRATPVHRSHCGNATDDHAINDGLIMNATSPDTVAKPTGRSVKRIKGPSCERSSLSPEACDLSRW